jgi:polysaccharide pyruvyl transferase WcaK-like protein
MKKTLLIGNFGARNIGDNLILSFALEVNKNVIVMTNDSELSQAFCEQKFETIQPFPSGIRSLFRYIFQKDVRSSFTQLHIHRVVFPGGGLFAIKPKADFIWACQFWWAKKFYPKAEFIFEYQGIDSKPYFLHKFFVKNVFSKANSISVRDDESAQFLHSLGIKNVVLKEDRVLEKLRSINEEAIPDPLCMNNGNVLVNAKNKISKKRWQKIRTRVQKEEKEIVFVCFDPTDALFVPAEFKGKVFFPHTKTDTYELFQNASAALGQRLHFLILAEHFCGNKSTFILGKPYAEKVSHFCRQKNIKGISSFFASNSLFRE